MYLNVYWFYVLLNIQYHNIQNNIYILFSFLLYYYDYLIYEVLITFINYTFSFLISWIVGFIYGYVTNTKKVFNQSVGIKKICFYLLWNIIYLYISIKLLEIVIVSFNIHERIAPVIIIVLTIPLNYIVTKLSINNKL